MKKIVLLLALAFCLNGKAQIIGVQKGTTLTLPNKTVRLAGGGYNQPQALIALYDSIYNWNLDTATMTWKYLSKVIGISYDVQQNQTSYLNQNWNGSTWVNRLIDSNYYNTDNKIVTQLQEIWNGTAWVDTFKISNTYDANYNVIVSLTQTLTGTSLGNASLDSSSYDSKNNRIYYIEKTWNGTAWVTSFSQTDVLTYNANNEITSDATPSSAYSPQTLTTYAYTSNNLLASYLSKYENPMFGWANSGNVFYYYNSNNMITDYEVYGWVPLGGPNPANGQWTLEEQTTYTYNTNNLVTTKQDFVNYGTSTLATYTYDANNNLTNILVQVPNDTNWVNGYQIAYTYDANNLKTSYTRKNFNSAGTKIVSGDSTVYYFNAVTGINQIKNSIAKISVYPNPNNGSFVIELIPSLTLPQGKGTLMQVYDVTGKLVLSQTINGKTTIDAGSLNEGVYNISLQSNEGVVNKRLVIVR